MVSPKTPGNFTARVPHRESRAGGISQSTLQHAPATRTSFPLQLPAWNSATSEPNEGSSGFDAPKFLPAARPHSLAPPGRGRNDSRAACSPAQGIRGEKARHPCPACSAGRSAAQASCHIAVWELDRIPPGNTPRAPARGFRVGLGYVWQGEACEAAAGELRILQEQRTCLDRHCARGFGKPTEKNRNTTSASHLPGVPHAPSGAF